MNSENTHMSYDNLVLYDTLGKEYVLQHLKSLLTVSSLTEQEVQQLSEYVDKLAKKGTDSKNIIIDVVPSEDGQTYLNVETHDSKSKKLFELSPKVAKLIDALESDAKGLASANDVLTNLTDDERLIVKSLKMTIEAIGLNENVELDDEWKEQLGDKTLTEAIEDNDTSVYVVANMGLQMAKSCGLGTNLNPNWQGTFSDNTTIVEGIRQLKSQVNELLPYEETSWQALVNMRNAGMLVKGRLYRIIDYVTTSYESNTDSKGRSFDVIVLATNNGKLSEDAWTVRPRDRRDDEYYNYSSDYPSRWTIKYCLDNDYNRFEWASTNIMVVDGTSYRNTGTVYDGRNTYNRWEAYDKETLYTRLDDHYMGMPIYKYDGQSGSYVQDDTLTMNALEDAHGTGVIYYMKDQNGNEAPYDFKNIRFTGWQYLDDNGTIQTCNDYRFTFCVSYDSSSDASNDTGVYCNKIMPYYRNGKMFLPRNIFYNNDPYCNTVGTNAHNNTIGSNTNGSDYNHNINIKNGGYNILISYSCYNIDVEMGCHDLNINQYNTNISIHKGINNYTLSGSHGSDNYETHVKSNNDNTITV